jgi:hypothetical protein
VKSVMNTYRKRNFGGGLWKPPRLIKYAEREAVQDVPKDFFFHHLWPKRYMNNAARYGEGLTIEVPSSLHTMRGTGMDKVLDDYLIREMRAADGFTWAGGAAGADPANYAKVVEDAPAFFKALKPARQEALIKGAYEARYGLDLKGLIGLDGLKP